MTDQSTPPESPITDRAHQELAEALGLSPHTGKTWDDLLKMVEDAQNKTGMMDGASVACSSAERIHQ